MTISVTIRPPDLLVISESDEASHREMTRQFAKPAKILSVGDEFGLTQWQLAALALRLAKIEEAYGYASMLEELHTHSAVAGWLTGKIQSLKRVAAWSNQSDRVLVRQALNGIAKIGVQEILDTGIRTVPDELKSLFVPFRGYSATEGFGDADLRSQRHGELVIGLERWFSQAEFITRWASASLEALNSEPWSHAGWKVALPNTQQGQAFDQTFLAEPVLGEKGATAKQLLYGYFLPRLYHTCTGKVFGMYRNPLSDRGKLEMKTGMAFVSSCADVIGHPLGPDGIESHWDAIKLLMPSLDKGVMG